MGFRLAPKSMADGRHCVKILLKKHNSGCIQHRDMMFGSRVGFSGSADLMAQLSIFTNLRWRLTAILDIQNGHITSQPDVMFGWLGFG